MYKQRCRFILAFLATVFFLSIYGCSVDPKGDLDDATFAALDIGIVSVLTSRAAIHPVKLSDALTERHEGYKGIKMKARTLRASIEPSLKDGSMNGVLIDIKEKGLLISSLKGSIETTIYVLRGEIGIVDGELYFSEGTQIDTDGDDYVFRGDQWQIDPPPLTIGAVVVDVDPARLNMFGLNQAALQPVIKKARGKFTGQEQAAWEDLVGEIARLKIKSLDSGAVLLGDIARVEIRNIEPSSVDDESIFILQRAE